MSKAKVLVIDDDLVWLDLARFHLESNGYEVISADTGAQGVLVANGTAVVPTMPVYQVTSTSFTALSGSDPADKRQVLGPFSRHVQRSGGHGFSVVPRATQP